MSSNFEEVKSKANIENVLSSGLGLINLKISGNEFKTDCPFEKHSKSKNPFSINQTTGAWTCFACDDEKNGPHIINLVEKAKRISFPEAIKYVEEYSNITTNSFQPTFKISQTTQKKESSYTPQDVITCWNNAINFSNDSLIKQDTYFKYKKLTPPNNAKFGQNPYNYKSTLMPFQDIHGNFKGFVCLYQSDKYNFKIDDLIRFMLLGQLKNEGFYYIGEGIATVQTVWQATNQKIPAIAVGGWINMLPVLQEVTSTYSNLIPIVLLDLDKKNKITEIKNINSNAICISPQFKIDDPNLKDFNDLLSKEGQTMEVIEQQVENALKIIQEKNSIITATQKTELKTNKKLLTADLLIQDQEERLAKYKGKEFLGLPQKTISTLDTMLLGLRKYMILAAAPNVGKTALAIQLAIDIIKNNENTCVLFLSFEMSRNDILDRMRCHLASMTFHKLHFGSIKDGDKGWYTSKEEEALKNSKEELQKYGNKILILDEELIVDEECDSQISTETMSTDAIITYLDRLKKETNSNHAMIIMDYFQVFPIPDDQNSKLRSDLELDKYRAKQMIKLRKKLQGDPLIVISETRKPSGSNKWADSMADLMGSSRLAYSADIISLLNPISDEELEKEAKLKKDQVESIRDKLKKQGLDIVKLTIAKARDGMQKGSILLFFHFLENKFEETTWIAIKNKFNLNHASQNDVDEGREWK
ncbi:AAA family ATPase [Candidatus Dependentiae bacterium]|nr:AAA family ATPase [Candidatus Dependentiae bacterium]